MKFCRTKLVLMMFVGALCGCDTLGYYRQAISGHWDLMGARVSIDKLTSAPDTPAELKRKLLLVATARDFAIAELQLPDNGSYRSYADLGRDYVVWNVFAAPELSLTPVPSCFVFVGCLNYRGFFHAAQAAEFGATLSALGHDVFVGGVAAYSTLGWFDDPILNTMLVWNDMRIIEVMFHELAHQLVYAKDDTVFNESFATAVAEVGVERWLAQDPKLYDEHAQRAARQRLFHELLLAYRDKLEVLYSSTENDQMKRTAKTDLFTQLLTNYAALKQSWDGYDGYDDWMLKDLNNAKLASIATYRDYVPALRSILNSVDNNLVRFYAAAEALAELSQGQRERCLRALNGEVNCLHDITSSR